MAQKTFNATTDSVLHQYQANVSWTTAVNATDGTDALENQGSNIRFVIAYFSTGLTAQVRRSAFIYDTSTIPVGSVITGVQEKIYIQSKNNPGPDVLLAWVAYTGSKTTPAVADYNNFGTTEFRARVSFDTPTAPAYNTYTLDSNSFASIIPGGTSAIGHRTSADLDDSLASGSEHNLFADWDSGNPAQLIVDYIPPGGGFLNNFI